MVIKLSDTLPDTPSSNLVCNVHGVRSEFLGIGASASKRTDAGKGDEVWTQGAYFLGKALYTKGYVDGGNTFGFWGVCARPANIRRSPWTAHGGHHISNHICNHICNHLEGVDPDACAP